ncbi:disease resistance RPP13-like protein 4 [Coffea eugenioides]|uniref:disease resistance RPP13-like protein 4 n=1 Tax=Coffea eugenioides TaxID=49369 RepID=UPI000F610446|nr:disease resistance RPP13-like protein 4 [Coffea eugenioides]
MGSVDFGEVSHYLLAKFSALLDEAERDKDGSRISCIWRFRSAETRIKSKYANAINTSKITTCANSCTDLDIRKLLYDLISALSECRVFAQQHRRAAAVGDKKGFLGFKHLWFISRTNRKLDDLDKRLKQIFSGEIPTGADPASIAGNKEDDDDDAYDDEEADFSTGSVGLDPAAETVEKFIVEGCEDDTNTILKGFGIVGFGGSGKTTLARKVFLSLKNMFWPRIWVSLSGTLCDAAVSVDLRVKILRKMLEQAGGDVSELSTNVGDIPNLTEKLYRRLTCKRYLIVLDEVWHVNGWYGDLCSEQPKGDASFGDCISHALPKDSGGRIIVTTRRKSVATQMVGEENLKPIDTLLGQEIGWSVFSEAVRKDGRVDVKNNTLLKMEEIIRKECAGLPLVARALGTIIPDQMQKVDLPLDDKQQWKAILKLTEMQRWRSRPKEEAEEIDSTFNVQQDSIRNPNF